MRVPIGPSDTSPEALSVQIEGLRRMTPYQRLERALGMTAALKQLCEARIRATYGPEIGERELRLRLASLWLPRQTMVRAFGWDPAEKGY